MVQCIRELLAQRADRSGDRIAFVEGATGRSLTWGQLQAAAQAWEAVAAELDRDRRVGLLISDPLTMISAYLSALSAGVTVAPLNPAGPAPERARHAAALGLAAVVTDDPAAEVGTLECWVLRLDPTSDAQAPTRSRHLEVVGSAQADRAGGEPGVGWPGWAPAGGAAVVLASSGTTGTPKIIPLTEQQLLHTARAVVEHHELGPSDRGYSPLPLFHINALVVGVLSTLVAGASLIVERRFSARSFWPVAGEHGVTWLNLVPAIIGILAEAEPPPARVAGRISFARSASAPLPGATRERFERRTGIGIIETYGMTEAASQITANPRDPAIRRPGSVGQAVGLAVRVVDHERRLLPAGEVGQVQIRGASVVDRYWSPWPPPVAGVDRVAAGSASGLSASGATGRPATHDGWLDTGDLGRLDPDAFLYLAGRMDDVINRGGEKVFPRDVEEVLLREQGVTAAAVVGRPHPTTGQEPVAFVLAQPGVDRDELTTRLWRRCREELSRFRQPADILVTDSLPAGPTGKIRHAELRRELARATVLFLTKEAT